MTAPFGNSRGEGEGNGYRGLSLFRFAQQTSLGTSRAEHSEFGWFPGLRSLKTRAQYKSNNHRTGGSAAALRSMTHTSTGNQLNNTPTEPKGMHTHA